MPRAPSQLNWSFAFTKSKWEPSYWRRLPLPIRPYAKAIPLFAHGKKVTFGDLITEKGNITKTIKFPNIATRYLYSRVLDLNIFMRISTEALRMVDKRGGFDEYVISTKDELIGDEVGLMYKRLITKHYKESLGKMRQQEDSILLQSKNEGLKEQLDNARLVLDTRSALNPKIAKIIRRTQSSSTLPLWPQIPAYALQAAKSVLERNRSKKY
ncbi:hypothetical protein SmJEL517_g04246 [Synchytrium microbalum]|uniref:Uncharacterized protein n=1 Tax=Synchytrium microbalum TaxID=1806994 RepID=A0A507C002_9FUNG|nr:uncharacterized protein SmJEL517_g04246 [Synchytrium microbalum]TPX32711.1 hypothetical protein SmJEL517_g04246 [Synchytrium microbalum]